MIVISTGCPAGVGPEVSVAAAARAKVPCVLVGDFGTLVDAARVVGVPERRLVPFAGALPRGRILVYHTGPALAPQDRRPGKPSQRAGAATLEYLNAAYDLVKARRGAALVTAPVSKHSIARSRAKGASRFRGHTEWLQQRDKATTAVMCFVSETLATSLVTTHLPISRVSRAITPRRVSDAIIGLHRLLTALGVRSPEIAVASLNPHAGEGQLFGNEERRAITPGIRAAGRVLKRGHLHGPIGAETAFRRALTDQYDGVVAMYHDQATIPLKLVGFGETVNVTMGLGIVRTSVDHGTAYDIAWSGRADAQGMARAIEIARTLSTGPGFR